ncbi:MAG: Lrp/AsnC family transcriptional regulator [Clostridia bacterium]|nr:Lrp/AsnC family transcriptional regulator [Clostridia bacterium]MBQ2938849.1 Lrp/AsnC family transcriptional regulator [Clostridia bacterium]
MDKLLKLLDTNARLSNAELAVMTGSTEDAVAKQIAAWEKDGVIRAYKALVDWDRTDREYVTAIIELRVTPKRDAGFEAIAQTIAAWEEVESIYLMSGGYDFSIVVTGRTFKEVAMFVANRLSTLDSVVSTATHFVLRRYKEKNVMYAAEEKDEREGF